MGLKILLVDDSATVRAILARTLRICEIPVDALYEAANGEEALGLLGQHRIDLVFADINMPVMNGIEMIDKMKEGGLMDGVAVVVVSTEGSQTRIEELRRKGVVAYLRKPFTPESIRHVVTDVMGEHG